MIVRPVQFLGSLRFKTNGHLIKLSRNIRELKIGLCVVVRTFMQSLCNNETSFPGMSQTSTHAGGSDSVSSSASGHLTTASSDVTHVRPFTLQSDASDGESDSANSITTLPEAESSYVTLARQSGATRKTG